MSARCSYVRVGYILCMCVLEAFFLHTYILKQSVHMHKYPEIACMNVFTLNCIAFTHWVLCFAEFGLVDWLTLHVQHTHLQTESNYSHTLKQYDSFGVIFFSFFTLSCRYSMYVCIVFSMLYMFLEFIFIAHHWQSSTVDVSFNSFSVPFSYLGQWNSV